MKKWICFVLITLLAVGCTPKGSKEPEPKEPQKQETLVSLYYANDEYINTGDESKEKFIKIEKKFEKNKDFPMSILKELQKKPDDENAQTLISDLKFLDVEIKDKTAYVNLSSKNLNGGSLQELFVIGQVVYSLTSVEDIKEVQFLVDGEKTDTLMGHYDTSTPFTKDTEL
ncbi:GerMN domain-containing protein [Inediibacterium massiliense]|uniref:GerMN domain-containing protein n=1 Tax=Inediibacterium massiliense TaxID=1658111 RepID=UPI0006B4852C|nr:GerMN domain-containing protein [Inediibacterium massiliense]